MAALPIVTLKECKDRLSIVGGTDDPMLIKLIQEMSSWIEKRTGRTFKEQTAITEFQDGYGRNAIYTRLFPLTTTTPIDLRVDIIVPAVFGTDTQKVENTDYVVDYETGEIELIGNTFAWFPRGKRIIKITYSAGYLFDDIPGAVKDACIYAVGYRYQRMKDKTALFQSTKTIGSGSNSTFREDMPPEVETALEPFTTVRMGLG